MREQKTRTREPLIFPTLAMALETASAAVLVALNSLVGVGIAGGLHLLAALCSLRAARQRREDLSQVEGDLVFWTALLVPVFGPILAWRMPFLSTPDEVENAHQVFERYAEHVKPSVPDYERTLFTGDYEKDLARELDAESYHEVLRHGATDQKRNALRRLADLGEPKHFALIRNCLLDPEHEVRLYAYSELERTGRVYEDIIAKRTPEIDRDPNNGEALLVLAQAYGKYAASGILDEGMATFYFKSADSYAARARQCGVEGAEPVWLRAFALARIHDFDGADEALDTLSESEKALTESCIARADVAFRRRDFDTVRVEAERVRQAGGEMPDWLAAMDIKSEVKS